jgi:uncharacterized protein
VGASRYFSPVVNCALQAALAFALMGFLAQSGLAVPADDLLASLKATSDVSDFAEILSPADREALEQRCRDLRQKTGAQLAVVTLRSLEGGQVDDFAAKLMKQWGIGEAGKNNGVLLLVAINDRKARIEVGYGLEPVLPDALAGRVLQEQLFPAFRQQQYAAGLTGAVNRIAEIVEKNEPAPAHLRGGNPPLEGMICFTLFMIPFVGLPAFIAGICLRNRQFIPALFTLLFPAFAAFMAVGMKMPWPALALVAACGIGAGLFGYFSPFTTPPRGGRSRRSHDTWSDWSTGTWPAGGSSWDSSSGWSGGGFSGGGGGSWGGFGGGFSGGGGASGGW